LNVEFEEKLKFLVEVEVDDVDDDESKGKMNLFHSLVDLD